MKLAARAICVAMFAVCSASSALSAAYDKLAMPDAAKTVENGRVVQALVPQAEIKTNINGSYVAVAMGGGLLGALIDAEIQKNQAEKAELLVQPIREALVGYDADAKAKAATGAITQNVTWLAPKEQLFSRDATVASQMSVLDKADAAQVGFFNYGYGFNADFSSVRVDLAMNIANKATPEGKKPEARVQLKNLVYSAAVASVVSLPGAAKDKEANAKLWAEDNGARVRAALDAAFADIPTLGTRVLSLQAADLPALRDKKNKQTVIGNDQGRLIEGEGGNVVLVTNTGLVHIAELQQAAPAAQVAAAPAVAALPQVASVASAAPVAATPETVSVPPAAVTSPVEAAPAATSVTPISTAAQTTPLPHPE